MVALLNPLGSLHPLNPLVVHVQSTTCLPWQVGIQWDDVMALFYAFQLACCLEGRSGEEGESPPLAAQASYLAGAADGSKRKVPVVDDPACNACFGRLRRACEEAC